MQRAAFGSGFLFHLCDILRIFDHSVEHGLPTVFMHDFPTSEKDGYLASVATFNEAADVVHLGLVVVLVRFGAKLDFLDLDNGLALFGFLLFLLGFVLELAVIHDTADRRIRFFRHFYEIQPQFFGRCDCLVAAQDSKLFAFCADDAYFPRSDLLITPDQILRLVSSRPRVR